MDKEQYEAEIEYLKNKIDEIDEYYRSIIEMKDDTISDLQNEIMELNSRY